MCRSRPSAPRPWRLARAGLLDNRYHTSNARAYLAASGYRGGRFYREVPAISDQGVITASGVAPIDFAREIFQALGPYGSCMLDAWFALFKYGDAAQVFELAKYTNLPTAQPIRSGIYRKSISQGDLFMTLKDFFLAQLDREAALTRKHGASVRGRPKRFQTARAFDGVRLSAALVAHMLGWIAFMIDRDEIDLAEPSSPGVFGRRWSAHQGGIAGRLGYAVCQSPTGAGSHQDEHLLTPWAFKMGGPNASEEPRYLMIMRRRLQPPCASSRTTHGVLCAGVFDRSGALRASADERL